VHAAPGVLQVWCAGHWQLPVVPPAPPVPEPPVPVPAVPEPPVPALPVPAPAVPACPAAAPPVPALPAPAPPIPACPAAAPPAPALPVTAPPVPALPVPMPPVPACPAPPPVPPEPPPPCMPPSRLVSRAAVQPSPTKQTSCSAVRHPQVKLRRAMELATRVPTESSCIKGRRDRPRRRPGARRRRDPPPVLVVHPVVHPVKDVRTNPDGKEAGPGRRGRDVTRAQTSTRCASPTRPSTAGSLAAPVAHTTFERMMDNAQTLITRVYAAFNRRDSTARSR
jgi:hypothetical protein